MIFLKYGLILEMRTSPLWHLVVCGMDGRFVASTAPALLGCMFSVEKYVDTVSSDTGILSDEYWQISDKRPDGVCATGSNSLL